MEKILIAGGNGFVGKNMQDILRNFYRLSVIDISERDDFKYDDINYYINDFSNKNEIATIIQNEKPDYIINLISFVTAERDMEYFDKMIEVNFQVFLKLYEAIKNMRFIRLFIQFGTAEEYGNIQSPIHESVREYPMSPYAIVKQMTTNTAIMLHKNYGFPVCVVRPGNLFGKYQPRNKFIPYILEMLKKHEDLNVSFCEQKRDFITVESFINSIRYLIQNSQNTIGKIINISSGTSVSLKKIIEYSARALESKSKVNYGVIPYRENEMMDFSLDITRLKELADQNYDNIDMFNGLENLVMEMKKV